MPYTKDKSGLEHKWRAATQMVRGGTGRSVHGETSEAIFMNSGYVYDSPESAEARFLGEEEGYVYSRYANPTVAMFEKRMCLLEGAPAARGTASGMSAVFASLASQVKSGDHVVAARALFGSSLYILKTLLTSWGVEVTFVDGVELDQWADAIKPNTVAALLETPTNPTLDVLDIQAISYLVHKVGGTVIVDNVFATPIYQKPLELGADIVVYSATKHIDGQGRCLGGVILGTSEFVEDTLHPFLKHTGPSLSSFNAWTLLKGLETLPLRVQQMTDNARKIATALEGNDRIKRVIYPGLESHPQHDVARQQMSDFSSLIALEIDGGKKEAFAFLNNLEIIDISNNLGDAKSLVTHPQTTTHQSLSEEDRLHLGIDGSLLRLSVGLEDGDDLVEDITNALKTI
jgi:O-succinylhomoserine sulfhydrylase